MSDWRWAMGTLGNSAEPETSSEPGTSSELPKPRDWGDAEWWSCDGGTSWWSCNSWRNNWWESGEKADWWESGEKADWETQWSAAASSWKASSLETENWWQHICKALRRWLSARPHMQKYVDVDGLEVPPPGDCVVFPLNGMWSAEPYLDASQYGEKLGGNGVVLHHGCAVTRLQSILSSTRLVRGGRGVDSKKGVYAAETLEKALCYAPPACLTAFAGERPVQCVFRLRAYRSLRIKRLKGCRQYILRENWCQLEALIITPWDREFPPRPKDFHTKADEIELPPNEPVQNWSFFKTWDPAPLEFTRTLEEQRRKQVLVLEC
jgi:hypothetical protein